MITILSGDRYIIKERLQALKDGFLAENDPLSLEEVDVETMSEVSPGILSDILTGVSLLSSRRMVVLKKFKPAD